jgi:putative transposase
MGSERQGNVPRKRHTQDEIVSKLREGEVLLGQGQTVGQVTRALAIVNDTWGCP